MTQFTVALLGAGQIGEAITALLAASGSYKVIVHDSDSARAEKVASAWSTVSACQLDVTAGQSLREALQGVDAVISALPYFYNLEVARAAAASGIHYFDLTEDIETAREIEVLARGAQHVFVPQCGLAPGFISMVTAHLMKSFEQVRSVKMRVGALPLFPTNRLHYNLSWSTEGLINEYGNPCQVLLQGVRQTVLPLEGYERFSFDGDEYEAFNTSGGLGSLCETLEGKVDTLSYKSVRYLGHRDLIAFLMEDLRFNEDREMLKKVFERSIATTTQDKCVLLVEILGQLEGRLSQRTYAKTIYHQNVETLPFSAIQLTTASGICTVVDLLLTNALGDRRGFLRSEEVPLPLFLENRFGKYYG